MPSSVLVITQGERDHVTGVDRAALHQLVAVAVA